VLSFVVTAERIGMHCRDGAQRVASLPGQARRSFLKFDHVRAVINPHGAKLAEDILTEQSIKIHVKHLLQLVQIHNGNLLRGPHMTTQLKISGAPQRISDQPGARLMAGHALQLKTNVTVDFCANDSSVGAGIEQKYSGITVHFAFHNNQGLHGAERDADRAGMCEIRQGNQQEEQESQRARKRPATLGAHGAHWRAPGYVAPCVQNGAAAG
jgi:hypothetical protein